VIARRNGEESENPTNFHKTLRFQEAELSHKNISSSENTNIAVPNNIGASRVNVIAGASNLKVVHTHPCCCRDCKHKVNGGTTCEICHVPTNIKRTLGHVKKYDTSNKNVCPVHTITVRSNGPGMNNAPPDEYEKAISKTDSILSALGSLAGGVTELQNALMPVVTSSAKLVNPQLMPFRVIDKHFLSDIDGRAQYGVIAAPGGDLGEFFLAMDTLEKFRSQETQKLTFEDVLYYFEDYLSMMPYQGKQYFFFQSDDSAIRNWERDAEVSSAASPANPSEKSRLLETISKPGNVGSRYFKLLLSQSEHLQTRFALVANILRAFFTIYYDTQHPSRPRLLFAVMEGKHNENGIVIIDRSRDYPCNNLVPLIVPRRQGKSLLVFHRAATELHRASMSEWITHKMTNGDQMAGRFLVQLNYQGNRNFDIFRFYYYNDLPSYRVAFAPQNEPLVT